MVSFPFKSCPYDSSSADSQKQCCTYRPLPEAVDTPCPVLPILRFPLWEGVLRETSGPSPPTGDRGEQKWTVRRQASAEGNPDPEPRQKDFTAPPREVTDLSRASFSPLSSGVHIEVLNDSEKKKEKREGREETNILLMTNNPDVIN